MEKYTRQVRSISTNELTRRKFPDYTCESSRNWKERGDRHGEKGIFRAANGDAVTLLGYTQIYSE